MYSPHNIPAHTKCENCGACCGPVPVNPPEFEKIVEFVQKNPDALNVALNLKNDALTCPFRDEKLGRCAIYPVRPILCRLFGLCEQMQCCKGNSANIDPRPFLKKHSLDSTIILSLIPKMRYMNSL